MTKNFVEIIGFAGHNPRRNGKNKAAPVRLSVATTERRKDPAGQKQERTEWHTILFWDRMAENAVNFVRKGSHILVAGSLKSRQYEVDGNKHTVWEIHARELLLLDPRNARTNDESEEPVPPSRVRSSQRPSA